MAKSTITDMMLTGASRVLQISLNLNDFEFALWTLNNRIDALREAATAEPPERPDGSMAIHAFADALDELASVARRISYLFSNDAASYKRAYDTLVDQDSLMAAK